MGWIIFAAYLLGFLFSVRPLAALSLEARIRHAESEREKDRRRYPNAWREFHPTGDIVPSDSGRLLATWMGIGKALAWPVIIPVHLLARTVVAPTEKTRADRAELKKLRKLAEREGLNWPDVNEEGRP